MKVVIDIPETLYRFYKTHIGSGKLKVEEDILGRLLNNGIVLPEGHGDLIDRSKFKLLMNEHFIDTSKLHYDDLTNAEHVNLGIENCLNEINEMEPVIKADKENKE